MKYFVGTSGWNYEHWIKRFYPRELSRDKWLEFYSKNFNTVEINYSFYKWPSKEIIKRWYKNSPKEFIFSVKSPRTITHIKKLKNVENDLKKFYRLIEGFKEKLGCVLFQLPPQIKFDKKNFEKIEKFIKLLDKTKINVIEFREKNWWNNNVYNLFKKNKIVFCNVSSQEMPKNIIQTTNILYFRFHGINYSSDYPNKELKNYAEKIKKLNAEKVFIYFNNDSNAYAIKNAKKLKRYLIN